MENNKTKSSAIQKILKCGIISWVAIIALWGIGSLKYDKYFLTYFHSIFILGNFERI